MSESLGSDVLLALWREATRQPTLAAAHAAMGVRLRTAWPAARVALAALDATAGHLTWLEDPPAAAGVADDPAIDLEALQAWAARGLVLAGSELGSAPFAVRQLARQRGLDSGLVGGVGGGQGTRGLLLAWPRPGELFGEADRAILLGVLEPFAAALERSARLLELTARREAIEAEHERLVSRLGGAELKDAVVGVDGGLKAVFERIALVSRSDLPVLILGETGSGKEVVAREIHGRSGRAAGPFIRVNCGAIPPELIDSELFGHERGSFTGATAQRRGWFERADHGTLFLDEVGDLPAAAQVRLLRVLQDGSIQRVGGEDGVTVDVRIVAATHRDLPQMVQDGRFREDLWYRLATFPIVLPPLRERRGDIPALARHFARRAAARFGLRLQLPTESDLVVLCAYDWPGNVRELAAVMDRAAILGDGASLEVDKALGPGLAVGGRNGAGPAHPVAAAPAPDPLLTLDEAVRRHIEAALAATRGRIDGPYGAARRLAINPHTLRARMRKLGIDWRSFHAAAQR